MSMPRRTLGLPTFIAALALAVACSAEEQPPADSVAAATPATAPAPALDAAAQALLAEQAGTWDGQSMPMEGDSVVGTWRVVSTADTTGWTITLSDVPTMPVRVVAVGGDSIVTEFGPYDDPQPDGTTRRVQSVRTIGRMENGARVGTYEVRLATPADSVIRGRFRGTRVP